MAWLRRCFSLFRQKQLQTEFEEEIAFHLRARSGELAAAGEADAELEARRRFGNILQQREGMRDARIIGWLDDLWQDLRYALRQIRRSPVMSAAAVGSLALAIGANSAVFSVLNAALFETLPVRDPQKLVRLTFPARAGSGLASDDDQFSYPLFRRLRENAGMAARLFAAGPVRPVHVHIGPQREAVALQHVSGEAFEVLGVRPALGRMLAPQDDLLPGGSSVAVLSYGFWRRRFDAAPDVLGRHIVLNGTPYEIVGVAQRGFTGTEVGNPADLWVPTMMWEPREGLSESGWRNFVVFGRLGEGVPPQQLGARLQPVFSESLQESARGRWPAAGIPAVVREYLKSKITVRPSAHGTSRFRQQFSTPLWIVAGIAGMVLLVACGNLANLTLARASARRNEMDMRVALGATPSRLFRQVLVESAVMGTLGALGGVLLAIAGAPALLHVLDRPEAPARLTLAPDLRLLGFVLVIGLGASLSFGLAPALRACASHPNHSLRETPESRSLAGRALICAQVALSFVLIAASLLFTISLRNLLTLPAGFERSGLLMAEVETTAMPSETRQHATWEQLRLRLGELPRVRSCGYSLWGLFSGNRRTVTLLRQGEAIEVIILPVSPRFFETMGTVIRRGREFLPGDEARAVQPVIVNQTFARLWSGEADPVGRLLPVRGVPSEVIGLSEDAKYGSLREKAPAMIYVPGDTAGYVTFAIRTPEGPAEMAARVRQELAGFGGNLRLREIRTQSELVANTLARERLLARLSSFFALAGMALACLGVYGVLSYLVARRTREIGIRSALGASRLRIACAVFGHISPAFVLGLGAGAALTAGLAHFAEHIVYGIRTVAPLPFFLAGGILTATALVSAAIPALRASRVDATLALRHT